jgi:hypothetical protein
MSPAEIIAASIGCGIACRFIAASIASIGHNLLSIVRAV